MQDGYAVRSSSPDLDYESDDDADDVGTDGLVVPPSHIVNERAIWLEQQQAGQVVLNSNSKQLLNDMLDEVYAQLQPKRADWDARQSVILFITKFVNHKIPGSSISAFGSFVMDLFTSSSDLDLSLNLADWKCDRSRNDKVHYLRKVAKALYGLQNGLRQSVQKIETVYRAAVPVVKFVEFKTGIECDISVENNDGVLKSRVLGMFSTMDSRFRQLCYLVKAWAKKHNVNSSKNGTLNSLSICLLVAFHLQTCSPPIFPPFSVFMEGLHLPSIGSCLQVVESRVQKYKNEGFGKRNTESVPELFGSFFLKLIAVESLWGQGLCSSTYEGRWISKIWPKNHIGCISVEDFADRSQNVARSVSRKEFELIYQVLQSTVSNLKDPVLDVLEAKDLKTYLFGSIKQKHRGVDHDLTASTGGNWQSGNDWSSSGDKRFNTAASKGQESAADRYFYADGSWGGHKVSTPVYVNHFQGGRGPGQRANAYRKVERSTRPTEVDSNGFESNGHRDASAIHPTHLYRVQYPPPNSRSQPMGGGMGQGPMYRGPSSFRDPRDGLGQEAFPSQYDSLDPNCNGGYVHREGDFPSIDSDRGGIYPETLNPGFSAAVPPQAGRPTYAAIGHGQGRYHSGPAPGTPSGQQRPQKPERDRRGGQRGRRHQPPGGNRHAQQQYTQNGYPIHGGGGEQWAAKPSDHQFLIR